MPTGVYIRSKELRRLLSAAHIGKYPSDETKKKMSIARTGSKNHNYGQRLSEETRNKMSIARTGKTISEETRNKMSIAHTGKMHTEMSKKKMSLAQSGSKNHNYGKAPSEETRKKISVAKYGVLKSKETRQRMSKVQKNRTVHSMSGKAHTKETKRKQRVGAIAYIKKTKEHLRSRVGKNEKVLLDKQECIDNVHIIRQYEIKELGYIPDGYCPETNTVYEVYEKAHDRTVFEDLQRETEICNLLSCNFHIIWDRTH